MDEQPIAAYLNLIQELLGCPNGEEGAILSRSSELVDEGLVIMCQQVAEMLREQGKENQAGFLINLAEQLAEYLNMTENGGEEEESHSDDSIEDYQQFLQELIQIKQSENTNRKIVHQFLAQNQNKLDLTFAKIITKWFESKIDLNNSELNQNLASLLNSIAVDIAEFPFGEPINNIEIAIACYENVLTVYTKDAFLEQWVMIQNNLATAYLYRIKGSKADNLELAITCYENVLTVCSKDDFPKDWAMTQNNLATAYLYRIKGDRATNLELAITCYQNSLIIRTKDTCPEQWAMTQNNLGETYRNRINGVISDNLEEAITCYENALTIFTKDDFPKDWAMTQNNLATAYLYRIKGDRATNLELAITYYQSALLIYTPDTLPREWATTQNNLATTYSERIKGSRADNLELAIACFQSALTVLTKEAFPEQWATTQNNLATTYSKRIKGSRTNNLEMAITCYQSALLIYTPEAFPEEWATTQNNLAIAYKNRIKGVKADNLESAITFCTNALTVRTKDAFPEEWATTQNNLATVCFDRIKGVKADNLEEAITCYENALTIFTKGDFPEQWAMTQNNLATAYLYRIKGDRPDNVELAITLCTNALTVRSRDAFPQDHAATLNNLGLAYQDQSNYYNNDPAKKQNALKNAFNTFKEALDVVEYIRGEITDAEAKTKLNEEWNRLYQGMVQVCLELDRKQEAIEYVDRSKARNLVEQIALSDAYPQGDIPADVRQHLQELRNLITEEDRRLQQDSQPNYNYINQLRHEYQDKFPYQPLSFEQIQKLLDEKTAILEWYILPGDESKLLDRKLLTFIITSDSLKLQVFLQEDLDQLDDFRNKYLEAYRSNNDQWQDDLTKRMTTLSNILHLDELLASVLKELPQCEKLILIPHLYLHLFPIHALPVMHNDENKPLQEYFSQGVSYSPNCQLLQQAQKRQYSEFNRLFAIQNPTQDLNFADIEVEAIARLFEQLAEPTVLQHEAGEKSQIIDQEVFTDSHCIHFSCHGYFNFIDALKSALILANSQFSPPPDPEDDPTRYLPLKNNKILDLDKCLTLENILQLKLKNCRLVSLSACETAVTDFQSTSDEYISLTSGFILAGVPNVVSTLWAISDISAAILMIHFYQILLADRQKSVAVALRTSQKWLREATTQDLLDWADQCSVISQKQQEEIKKKLKFGVWKKKLNDKRFNSPYHWAAFCAIGQ